MRNEKYKLNNSAGFSLVELMVVTAIIGIIAAISWVTLGEAKRNANAQNACEQVASMINKTRNYALSGRLSSAIVTINGNLVTINTNPLEKFTISSGISCGNYELKYQAPSAVGEFAGDITITCSGSGVSRDVTVTRYGAAVCN